MQNTPRNDAVHFTFGPCSRDDGIYEPNYTVLQCPFILDVAHALPLKKFRSKHSAKRISGFSFVRLFVAHECVSHFSDARPGNDHDEEEDNG